MQFACWGAGGMDRGDIDAVALEYVQQCPQRTWVVFGQVDRQAAIAGQIGQQVTDALEAVIACGDGVGINGLARGLEKMLAKGLARGLIALTHLRAQGFELLVQGIQHRQYVRVAELDVLVNGRIHRQQARQQRGIQFKGGGTKWQ